MDMEDWERVIYRNPVTAKLFRKEFGNEYWGNDIFFLVYWDTTSMVVRSMSPNQEWQFSTYSISLWKEFYEEHRNM